MNKVILIGRLTRDPELRTIAAGTSVARFTLAVDRRPRPDGSKEADFLNVVVWGKLGENCSKNLNKGRLVAVDGRIQVRTYESPDGQKHTAAEIVAENIQYLSPKPSAQGGPASEPSVDAEVPGEDYSDQEFSPEE